MYVWAFVHYDFMRNKFDYFLCTIWKYAFVFRLYINIE